jgi:ribose transport system permease protein
MRKELGMTCALAALCLIIFISNHKFVSLSNWANTSNQVAMLGIFAIGVGFVIITGGIDLSIGSVIGLTGVVLAKLSAPLANGGLGQPIAVGITVALTIAVLIGLAQGLLITRLSLQPFIVTLGGMLLIKGLSHTIAGGGTISFGDLGFRSLGDEGWHPLSFLGDPTKPEKLWNMWDCAAAFIIPWSLFIFAGVALLATYLLHFTVFGRHLFAIGGNRDAALYSGIPVKRIEVTTYVISAGLAGVAGIPLAAYIGQMGQDVGSGYELYAITAAVIGGCSLRGGEGTILGMVIGTTIIRVLDNGINMFQIVTKYDDKGEVLEAWRLNETWKNIIIGAVILTAVILDQVSHIMRNRKRTVTAQAKPAPAPAG